MGRPIIDLTGKRFGYLTIIKQEGTTKAGNAQWLCKCDCGNEKIVAAGNLVRGFITSCGCKRAETISNKNKKHGESRSRIYLLWSRIKVRCNKVKCENYKNYGGRGISYCKEWESFEPFYNWAIANGYADDLTIDRIDVNGNYEPSNCRWVTMKEQQRNKRNNHYIYYQGQKYCATELAEKIGMNVDTLKNRLNKGLNIDEATSLAVKKKENFITHNGETHNITEWENILGFKHGLIKERLRRNWTIKQTLETPIFGNKDNYK